MSEERIRFTFNPEKALEALVWVARQWSDISFYYMVKVLYYADKEHLNRFGRPILGDHLDPRLGGGFGNVACYLLLLAMLMVRTAWHVRASEARAGLKPAC